jgi:high affinity Mn2+ porin
MHVRTSDPKGRRCENRRLLILLLALWIIPSVNFACIAQSSETAAEASLTNDPPSMMFSHSSTSRYWISAQENIIFQAHPSFPAKYSGPNSLHSHRENATSNIGTLYLGYRLADHTEVFVDVESAAGGGISDALGLAGFTNVDVVRNPQLGVKPYLARGMLRQIVPLSSKTIETERGPLALATSLPARRLEFRAGKFGMADFFDLNSIGSDSHYQFMNWTVDNNGAYDYAADTRGYTVGAIAEYDDSKWSFRFAEALMPTVANGIDLQWNLRRARSENYELELRPQLWGNRKSAIRLLAYENHANMGLYRQAMADFLAGETPRPIISAHPVQTTIKYGFGVNIEQQLTSEIRGFVRAGWNEGEHESFAYTEVNSTFLAGGDCGGTRWKRKMDKFGAAFVTNAISADHQHYLALGGVGFLLGDGRLNYGRENILETYYNAHIWRGIYAAGDLQHINSPGYSRDRGPVWVPGLRFHLEF